MGAVKNFYHDEICALHDSDDDPDFEVALPREIVVTVGACGQVLDGFIARKERETEHVPPQAHSPQDDTLKGIDP